MDRRTFLWTITAFFGATVVFGLVRNATEGESAAVSVGFQALALAVIVVAIVVVQRRM